MRAVKVRVSGRVQGVYFRVSAKQKADLLSVKGSVCNTSDGAVELFLQGEEPIVNQMLDWCRVGPALARVDVVDVQDTSIEEHTSFEILH